MALNNPPEIMQAQSYTAQRWRRYVEGISRVQAGTWGKGDFVVTAGTGWNVNIAGGSAYVPKLNTAANIGYYHVEADAGASSLSATLTAADPTNPRVDQVVIEVDDTTDNADPDDVQQITVLAGTPTAGATLGNRTGAQSLGNNMLRLADVLVPAGAGSIASTTIRDRRQKARGVFSFQTLTAGTDLVITNGTTAQIGLNRVEFGRARGSGISANNMVELGMHMHKWSMSVASQQAQFKFQTQQSDSGTWTDINSGRYQSRFNRQANVMNATTYVDYATFAGGNWQIRLVGIATGGDLTIGRSGSNQVQFWIREIVAPPMIISKDTP